MRAQESMYWPGKSLEITDKVIHCDICHAGLSQQGAAKGANDALAKWPRGDGNRSRVTFSNGLAAIIYSQLINTQIIFW